MAYQDFWHRFNLGEEREVCLRAVGNKYAGYRVKEFEEQGYCSYTVLVTPLRGTDHNKNGYSNGAEKDKGYNERDERLVQFRPAPHALNLDIMHLASKTYPSLTPTVAPLAIPLPSSLNAYIMNKLIGTPLSRLLPRTRTLTPASRAQLETLISSFAAFIAQSWPCPSPAPVLLPPRTTRADSPMESDSHTAFSQCTGKVGSSLIPRLKKLATDLPDAPLREVAKKTLLAVQRMSDYPVVLNHGDLIPSNILVVDDDDDDDDEQQQHRWEVSGVVDWAEAEVLPFGTCLYGLEHLLGYLEPASEGSSKGPPVWVYFEGAARLREGFWEQLVEAVPGMRGREDEVRTMRDVGVLLWHGFAWDGGKIDRVVGEGGDEEELARLRAFLDKE